MLHTTRAQVIPSFCTFLFLLLLGCGEDVHTAAEAPAWAKVAPEQVAEAKKHGVPVAFENDLGMRFVLIPAGEFLMGSPDAAPRPPTDPGDVSLTPHLVQITHPYYMQVREVSEQLYGRILKSRPTESLDAAVPEESSMPVAGVSFNDAQVACELLSATLRRHYRLPTEAEWERACRCGTKLPFAYGASITEEQGNLRFGLGTDQLDDDRRIAVGSLDASPWGLHDMHGNVHEWCLDWVAPYPMHRVVDPRSSTPSYGRSIRGGDWGSRPADATCFERGFSPPELRWLDTGFRVVSPIQDN